MKLNLQIVVNTLKDIRNYMFPIKRITNKFKKITSAEELKSFVHERSAHVTQTTLYGYIKTRIGSRYTIMFEDKTFSDSINIAKWNIYVTALADCTFYVYSYLIDKKKFKKENNEANKIYEQILKSEKNNGLEDGIYQSALIDFQKRLKEINWDLYHQDNPFYNSSQALYKWAPISENLKILDKEIVLNSIKLKWNLVENEFKDFTKNLKFN